jgi:hypothetical protein
MPLPGMPNFRVKHEGYEVWWTALPEINDEGVVWFTYVEPGFIQVKNPDEQILHKMYQIAIQLNARLIGEEDEEYGEHGEVLRQPLHAASEQSRPKSKTWLQGYWQAKLRSVNASHRRTGPRPPRLSAARGSAA